MTRPGGAPSRPPKTALALLAGLAGLSIALACSRAPESSRVVADLEPVPYPSLAGAENNVQEQVEQNQRELETQLANVNTADDLASLAEKFSELGLVYIVYDFPDAAEVCFDNARRLMPDDYRWSYLGGYVRKLKGDLEEAMALLELSLELEPTFAPALLRLGRSHLELGQLDAARSRFEQTLAADPESPAALEGLGKIAVAEGQSARAVESFSRALDLAPNANSLHYALAQAYRDLGRLEDARRHLELSGDAVVPIPDPLISPLAALGESVQLYLLQGTEALDDKNYEVAAAAFEKLLEKDPHNFVGYKARAYSLERLGDLEGAITSLKLGIELGTTGVPANDPVERAEFHRILGGLKALRGDDEEAISHFEKSLEIKEKQPGTRLKLANALSRVGRYDAALPHYEALVETEKDFAADILVRRGAALMNLGRSEEALADFRRAVDLQPGDPLVHTRYADALEHLGRRREAADQRNLAEQAGGDADGKVQVLVNRGNVAAGQGRFTEAFEVYSKALELTPERVDIRFMRATTMVRLGRLAEAIDEFRQVNEAEPRHAPARHAEIAGLVLTDRYGEARMRLNEALRLFSLDARLAHLQARLLATCPETRVRDGRIASEVARRLADAVGGLRVRETLALALAANGQTARAVDLMRNLVQEAEAAGHPDLAADFRAKLTVLGTGSAWSARGPQEILEAAQDPR